MLTKEILDSESYTKPRNLTYPDKFDNHYKHAFTIDYYPNESTDMYGERITLYITFHYKEYKPEHTREFIQGKALEKNDEITAYTDWLAKHINEFRKIAIEYFFPKSKIEDMPIGQINIHYYEGDESARVGFNIYKSESSFSDIYFCIYGSITNPFISVVNSKDYSNVCFAIDNKPFVNEGVLGLHVETRENILEKEDVEKMTFQSYNGEYDCYVYGEFRYALNEEYTLGNNVVECTIKLNGSDSKENFNQFFQENLTKINNDLRWVYSNTDIIKTDVKANVFKRTDKDKLVICSIKMDYEVDA